MERGIGIKIFQIRATPFRHIIGERSLIGRIELATRSDGVGNIRHHGCVAICLRCPRPRVRLDRFLFRPAAIAGLALVEMKPTHPASRKLLGDNLNNSLNVRHILWIPTVHLLDTLLWECQCRSKIPQYSVFW